MKTTIWMVAVLLAGCGDATNTGTGGTDAGGSGGDGMAGSGGGTTSTTSTTSIPWDGSPYLGFGFDGAPCDKTNAFQERVRSGDIPAMASAPIHVPVDGFITRVTVVHAIQSATGSCDVVGRRVLISEPVADAVPSSPPVYEQHEWLSADVAAAPVYELPGQSVKSLSKTVELGRDLLEPLEVHAGDYVHIGSLLDSESICVLASGTTLDGAPPPEGHAYCVEGETWSSCAELPYPGSDFWIAYVGWVDFAPY
jgi:hypothetical protein